VIRINLLPKEEQLPEIPHARISLFFVAVLVVILGGIFAVVSLRTWSSEQDLDLVREHYEALRPVRDAMDQAGDKQKRIDAKMLLVKALERTRTAPYNIFPRIAAVLTEGVWLDETKVSQNNAGVIELKGQAVAYPNLAEVITRLEAEGTFKSVTLKSTEGDNKTGTWKFTIELKLKEM
jgi:Tfp pilus assembly protein PilN